MAEESKSVSLAILGIVSVIAVVGLAMLFTGTTGSGVYGGQMRQGESDIRPIGEEPLRYTSPVADGTTYKHRDGWDRGLLRDACPGTDFPVAEDVASAEGREGIDCFPSVNRPWMYCCRLGGQAGYSKTGVYE